MDKVERDGNQSAIAARNMTWDTRNLLQEAQALQEYWSPRVVGEVNDQYVKVAKLKGTLAWHKHDEEDELFLILAGNRDGDNQAYR